jgi:hypothetical protein
VRIDAKKIEKSRQQKFALRRQESFSESQQTADPFLDENDLEVYTSLVRHDAHRSYFTAIAGNSSVCLWSGIRNKGSQNDHPVPDAKVS